MDLVSKTIIVVRRGIEVWCSVYFILLDARRVGHRAGLDANLHVGPPLDGRQLLDQAAAVERAAAAQLDACRVGRPARLGTNHRIVPPLGS